MLHPLGGINLNVAAATASRILGSIILFSVILNSLVLFLRLFTRFGTVAHQQFVLVANNHVSNALNLLTVEYEGQMILVVGDTRCQLSLGNRHRGPSLSSGKNCPRLPN